MTDVGRLRQALMNDLTIDIVTRGAKTGMMRTTEIWYMRIDGDIYICGTPTSTGSPGRTSPRDWLANLRATPEFTFRFKETLHAELDAQAEEITDPGERRRVFSAEETAWYRDQGNTVDELVANGPVVKVTFTGSTGEALQTP